MTDDSDSIEHWVRAYQNTQEQLTRAHQAYQSAMAASHQAYMRALQESQARLLEALRESVDPERLRVLIDEGELPTAADGVARERSGAEPSTGLKRFSVGYREVSSGGRSVSGLGDDRLAIVSDTMGVSERVARLLKAHGIDAKICDGPPAPTTRYLLHLGTINDYSSVDEAYARTLEALDMIQGLEDLETLIAVHDLGGRFGYDICEMIKVPCSGLGALGRARFAPSATVKTIDLDVGYRNPDEVAQQLVEELLTGGDESVGLPEGARVARVLHDVPEEGESWAFNGVILVSVSGSSLAGQVVSSLASAGTPRAVLVGPPAVRDSIARQTEGLEHRWIDWRPDDLGEFFDEMDRVRESWGPVGAIVHANASESGELADVLNLRFSMLQVLLAATARDPIARLAIVAAQTSTDASAIADEMLRKFALAERDRRAGECVVKAITLDRSSEAAAALWREWSRDSEHVEVYLVNP